MKHYSNAVEESTTDVNGAWKPLKPLSEGFEFVGDADDHGGGTGMDAHLVLHHQLLRDWLRSRGGVAFIHGCRNDRSTSVRWHGLATQKPAGTMPAHARNRDHCPVSA